MKTLTTIKYIALVTGLFTLNFSSAKADNLETLFKETGWDRLLGTWTAESGMTTTFSWKSAGTVLESKTTAGSTERFSLMNRNTKSGKVYVASADNNGGSSQGTCQFEKDVAVFSIISATDDGEKSIKITYTMVDDNNLSVQVEGRPEPVKLTRK